MTHTYSTQVPAVERRGQRPTLLLLLALLAGLLVLLPLATRATNTVLTIQALGSATAPADDVTMFVDQVEIVQVPAGAVVGGTPLNASFETVSGPFVNFAYAPAGASWTFNSRSGITENGGAFGAATAPNGTRVAFLQSQGGISGLLEQTLPLGVGSYQVRFRMSQRNLGSNRNQRLSVRIDGVEVGVATTANLTGYDTFTSASFTVVVPTIASFSPASGAQGSLVTVTGTNMTTVRSVRFGELPAAFVVNSATQLTATVPRGASTHKLRVSTPGGPALSATAFGVSKFDSYVFPLVTASFNGLDVGDNSKPAFADLDGDGLLDMLVGRQNGQISHYEQTAANAPTFTLVTANFNGIGVSSYAAPALTDLDGDGRLDLLVGNFDGTLYHYEQAAPNSTAFTLVTFSLDGIDVGTFSAPAFTDLDGDGLLDLLVGNIDGNLRHYEQAATIAAAFTLVTATFNGIGVSTFAAPAVADLDGDGLLDLLVGDSGGGLSHYEQTAANATSFTLVTASFSGIGGGTFSTPAFTDLDGDGLLDLLVGKSDGTLSHYEQAAPPPTIASFSPASGPQGSALTVTGTRFTGTTSVRFGELPAAFVVNSATQLTVTVPRAASTHKLRVTTPGGGTALTATAFGVDKASSYIFPIVTASFNGLDVGDYSAPAFADLDGDGLLDMLVGKQDGFLSRYEQAAANSTTFTPVTGTFNGIDVGDYSAPTFTDLDGDGLLDMLVGNLDGVLYHYEQAAANSLSFALVTASFNGLDVFLFSKPAFTDLDGDGLLDMLVGNVDGNLYHYEQTAANATTFALVTASFNGITVVNFAAPTLADLDGDGLLDLLVGKNDGTLSHYEQTAANATTFALVTATFNAIAVGTFSAPTFTDLDGDGLLDMLVGKQDGTLGHYEQVPPVPTITSFSPASGAQGSTLTVTGTGFLGTTSVRFGELSAVFVVNSATQLTVTVPRGASTHKVHLTTPGGTALSATAFGVDKLNTDNFPLVTTSFNTIDAGDYSAPAFADLDGDGLLDMLVGKLDGTLSRYEQTVANSTTFALVTTGFNTIDVGDRSAPAFTDLDGDGLLDMLAGKQDGTLSRYEQAAVNSTSFALVTATFNTLDVGDNAAPAFTDLDGDGLLDLLVGKSDGTLNHYEQAAANAAAFALVTTNFNGISLGSSSAPAFADLDGDGLLDMLVGKTNGQLSHYEQTAANATTLTLVTATFNGIAVGNYATPAFTDLDGDGLLDLLVGKFDGTLGHYEQAPPVPTITSFSPASGPQGSTLTVTGTNFTGTTSVRFGELPAVFVVNSATQLTVTVPRGASTHKLRLTTPIGTVLSATAFGVTKLDSYLFPLVTASFNGIAVGGYSAPAFADLDGNGRLDVLVGKTDGTLSRYEQAAVNSTTFTLVTAGFSGIDVGDYSAPAFTDLDGDGLLDMLVGTQVGTLNHYEQAAANPATFTLVTAGFNGINVGAYAAPAFTDLDGDGWLDMLVGSYYSNLSHYEQAAANSTTFALVTASFNGISMGQLAKLAFADLDGDGRLDMVVGQQDGMLRHYEQAAANSPVFALVTAGFNGIAVGAYSAPAFTDLDGDGLLDMLVGKQNGTLSHYEQAPLVPTITSFSPASGPQGSTLTVTGTNFTGTTSVRFGELPAAFVVNSATQLTVTVPRAASTHKLRITTPIGTVLSAAAFGVTKLDSYLFPLVTASFNTLDVGDASAPTFADLDGDGLLDMVVGKQDGTLSHYEQTVANSTTFTLVTAGFNTLDVGDNAAPAFTDLDGDGLLDMLVGKQDGTLSRYEQTVANSTTFALVTTGFNTIDVGDRSAPAFTDLDGDGLLDMLVGKLDGTLSHYAQTAANSATFSLVTAAFNTIDVGDNAAPTFADLDGDGLLDLLVGKLDGTLSHYEQAVANSATFILVTGSFNAIAVGNNAAPAITDLDGDGRLDMLVGKQDGTLGHYEQVPPVPTITSFSPASGAQGSTLTVTGTGFTGTMSVRFGELPAVFVVNSATQLTVTVPRGASTHKLRVTTPGGTALSATAFAVDKLNTDNFPLVTTSFNSIAVTSDAAPAVADLDGDGLLDLLVGNFDGTLRRYEQTALNSPAFALVTASFSAIDVGNFSTPALTDLDGDGLLDLLVGENGGALRYYEQAAPNSVSFPLVAASFNGIAVGFQSTPAFTDLDGDGLLDLLVGEFDGNLNHYEQTAPNLLSFNLVTASFNGLDVGESSAPAFADLDGDGLLDLLVGKADGTLNHYEQAAANSTAFALVTASFNGLDVGDRSTPAFTDLDGDGRLDMLVGELDGNLNHYEQAFPVPTIASFSPASGPQGSLVTVTGTGFLGTTSVRFGELPAVFSVTSATQLSVTVPRGASTHRLHLTTPGGTALSATAFGVDKLNSYNFPLVTSSFSGIDVGNHSTPAFTDLDGDGLLDMLVGNSGGTLSHYEQAAANATAFTLVTATFNAIAVGGRAAPALTDLDGDGLLDLLVGNFDGTLEHYEQAAANSATFALVTATFSGIDVGNSAGGDYSAPAFTDLDGNGRLDLLVGKQDGTLYHYEQAAANSATFILVTTTFNGIDVGNAAKPAVADLDGDGLLDLLVGTQAGTLSHYEQIAANSLAFTPVTATFNGLDVGDYSAPALTDLDGDGRLDMLVGKFDGTLSRYEQAGPPPTITSFSPASGAQGSLVTVTGTGFLGTTSVRFGGLPAVFVVNSATQLTVTVPRGASTHPLQLTAPSGPALSAAAFGVDKLDSYNFPLVTASFNGIDVGNRSTPTFTDLDGDGLLDMLVGKSLSGNSLNHYEQAAPNSATFTLVTATFSALAVTNIPTFTDLDGNGLLDMLVGETAGSLKHYEQAAPNSTTFTLVTTTFSGINVGQSSAPAFTDLDGDGLLDMLVGTQLGTLSHYEQAPNSTTFTLVTATFNGIDVGDAAKPAVADLDGDGLLDMVVGNGNGNLLHYEQAAVNSTAFTLVTGGFNGIAVGSSAAPTFTDLDGDGLLDMVVGKGDGTLSRYEQAGPPPTITAFSPASGPQGSTLTITGTNLTTTTSVRFGELPAVFTVNSATQLTVTVPRGASTHPLHVSTPGGSGLSATAFGVNKADSYNFPLVTAGFNTLDVGDDSKPAFADLDGDGLLDMLVGKNDGTLSHYEQTTANAATFTLVTATFNTIDVGFYSAPAFTDLNGDGLLDMLVGKTDGQISHYEQTAANATTFALVTASFNTIDVGQLATPTFTDLDGDGRLDMLVGESFGTLRHYEQTAANATTFALVTASFNTIDVGNFSAPAFADLDGDGLLDMLVGNSDGTLSHYEQAAANATTLNLVTATFSSINGDFRAAPALTDLDGDGLLDLLIGKFDGTLSHYEQVPPAPTLAGLSPAAELPGMPVLLTGTGFTAGSTVSFGGVAAGSVTVNSPTSLTAVVPAGAAAGSSVVVVTTPGGNTVSAPAFAVLGVYDGGALDACAPAVPATASLNDGAWHYLLSSSGGQVVAAYNYTGASLGTLTIDVLRANPAAAVRQDAGSRPYLDRNFHLTASAGPFPGRTVGLRLYGLTTEFARLQAATPAVTLATLKATQYSGPNEDCQLANNSPAGERRTLSAPATAPAGALWFAAELAVADHFSEFYLTGSSSPLPVELTAFTATAEGPAAVRLAWATASEMNSDRFDVERSGDGRSFERIGTVAAAGSSSTPRRYELLDSKLPGGTTTLYYRLRQVDLDGTFSYSPVRTVARTSVAAGLALFPNPTHGTATLTGAVPGAVVTVFDALGRQVTAVTADATGTAVLTLPAAVPAGVYLVRSGTHATRLVVD